MVQARRFGKRMVVPSTVEIIREVTMLMGTEAERQPSPAVPS